jgi:hypothetical protein
MSKVYCRLLPVSLFLACRSHATSPFDAVMLNCHHLSSCNAICLAAYFIFRFKHSLPDQCILDLHLHLAWIGVEASEVHAPHVSHNPVCSGLTQLLYRVRSR